MKKLLLLSALVLGLQFANAQNAVPARTVSSTKPAAAAVPNAGSEMVFDNEEFNYGTIKQGESVTHEFVFTNAGKEPIIITNAQGSCGCTVPEWPKEPIMKGEKGRIKVTFNSAGKMGMQDKTVTITSNAKNSPRVLHLKGTIESPAPGGTNVISAPKN